jgi:hypothetical protein
MILDRDGEPSHRRVQRRPLRDGPGAQRLTPLEPQIEMQGGRVVKLDDEARHRHKRTAAVGSGARAAGSG